MMPISYGCENMIASAIVPSTVHNIDNRTAQYFARYLLQKAISVFEWKLPESWNKDYFLYSLYLYGYIGILNTDEYGVIPQHCTLKGLGVFYQPKEILVVNPALAKSYERTINRDCVLLKLEPDYNGISDMLAYYVEKLSLLASAVDMNIINSKLSYVFTAKNKAAAESFKKLYDNIMSGQPAVVVDSKLFNSDGTPAWQSFNNNLSQNYITTDLLSDMRKLETMFLTEIGIPNANTDKRERLVADEVNANNIETSTRAALWLESLQEGCKRVNEMFNLDISVDWRVDPNASNIIDSGTIPVQT